METSVARRMARHLRLESFSMRGELPVSQLLVTEGCSGPVGSESSEE
jgi:hypothetical protein